MTPDRILLALFIVFAITVILLAVAMLIGRWLAAAGRTLDFPDDDGETM